jgi:hypothetical protein
VRGRRAEAKAGAEGGTNWGAGKRRGRAAMTTRGRGGVCERARARAPRTLQLGWWRGLGRAVKRIAPRKILTFDILYRPETTHII